MIILLQFSTFWVRFKTSIPLALVGYEMIKDNSYPTRSWNEDMVDQLPVGFIAQLVEHCTGIAQVMGSNPVVPQPLRQGYDAIYHQ